MDYNKIYQMDLLDLDDKAYQPVPDKPNPFTPTTIYVCPKCREWVGVFIKGEGWQTRKEECRNGHRTNWEAVK